MDPSPADVDDLDALRSADLDVLGLLSGASNHTMLVRLDGDDQALAVYKPQRGERPLWDFPTGTLHRREVAAYVVSAFLGWDLVPPTVLRDGPFGAGSLQQFVHHDPAEHYFTLVDDTAWHGRLAQLATFDLLINNADRKGGHVLRGIDADALVAIDHGLTFHPEPKLRTVIWDLGGPPIDEGWRADLRRLVTASGDAMAPIEGLLSGEEVEVLRRRARLLSQATHLPDPPADSRPYPWPPV